MARAAKKPAISKNGNKPKPEVSELGKRLQQIRTQIEASGEKLRPRRELEREIRNVRFGG
jgi:hypothetical protein